MYRPGGAAADPLQGPADGVVDRAPGDQAVVDQEAQPLPPTATIALGDDPGSASVAHVLEGLEDELVGLRAVKTRIREIAALLTVERARERFGLTTARPSLHMSFTGAPGTGKTTVALRMAQMLHGLGYLRTPRVHAVTRDDLVGQFIGHTAPRTREALNRAAGGLLFIDEAYSLYRGDNERDYGQEAVEILLQEMEAERGDLVVVFAGYADRMEEFFGSNPGLSSRVAHHIEFEDYTHAELLRIADLMLAKDQYSFDDGGLAAFSEYLTLRMARPRFANARSVRNALERIRLRQASRLVLADRPLSLADLVTLVEADVRASRMFDAPGGPSVT